MAGDSKTKRTLDIIDGDVQAPRRGDRIITTLSEATDAALEMLEAPEKKHLETALYLVEPDAIWRERIKNAVRNNAGDGELQAGIVDFQVKVTDHEYALDAILNVATFDDWYDMVMAAVFTTRQDHASSYKGQWRPIAIAFGRKVVPGRHLIDNKGYQPNADRSRFEDAEESVKLQQKLRAPTEQARLVLTVVWFEVTGAPPYDTVFRERNRRDSPNSGFYESRQLAHAPQRTLEMYRLAERVHRRFISKVYPDGIPKEIAAVLGSTVDRGEELDVAPRKSTTERKPRQRKAKPQGGGHEVEYPRGVSFGAGNGAG